MKRPHAITLFVLCLCTIVGAEEIELTGLVDVDGCRMACFLVLPSGATPVLRPGQSAAGITLENLDARSGWAQVSEKAGARKIRLSSFCAPPRTPAQRLPHTSRVSSSGNSSVRVEWNGNLFDFPESFAVGPQSAPSVTMVPPTGVNLPAVQGSSAANDVGVTKAAPAGAASEQVTAPTFQAADATASTPAQTANEGERPSRYRLPQPDPSSSEGEQIKMLYGLEAFLAWDVTRGQAALEQK